MIRLLSLPLAALLLAISLVASEPAEAGNDRIAEEFITQLERKAIDRYLRHRGLSGRERQEILDPDGEYDLEFDDDEGGNGAKNKKNKGKKHKGLPPGLAKRDQLPPGLAKRSELPPGLAKRDLPDDLQDLLPDRDVRLELIEIDGAIVLIDIVTDTVLDIIEGALSGKASR